MNPLLAGFADELIKIGAFGQQHRPDDTYDSKTSDTMSRTSGPGAVAGGNKIDPKQPAPVKRTTASATPLTTPMDLVHHTNRTSGMM